MSLPLEGLRVVELATVLAGPAVGQFLAELGADVIKVEHSASRGDVTRTWKLPDEPQDGDRPAYFSSVNWGKRSIALDLREPLDRDRLHRMVASADVAITSFKAGGAVALGADAETMRALNPRLIVAQVVGYDESDPRPGYDAVIQAESGFMAMNGHPDLPPVKLPVALMDVLAADQLRAAILLALLRRERTGEGAVVSVSLFRAAVSALANQATNFLAAGRVPARTGSDHPNIAPYGTPFRTADGEWIVLAIGTDRQFEQLCDVLGLQDVRSAPTFATNQKRVRNRPFLHALLEDRIGTRRLDELLAELHEHGVPAGAVRNVKEVFEQPVARELVLRGPEAGLAGVRTIAFRMDGLDAAPLSPPPHFEPGVDAAWRKRSDKAISVETDAAPT